MERASKLIRGLRLSGDVITPEQLCLRRVARSRRQEDRRATPAPAKLVRTRLVVEVEDHTWQRQLFALTPHILANLEKTLGRGLVEDLEFRIVPRRREPAMRAPGRAGALCGRRRRHRRPRDARHLQALAKKGTSVKITEKEVRYVAGLANLTLTDAEIARLQADLDGILEHMDRLNEMDTAGVEPMSQVLFEAGETATLRADVPVPPLGNQAALANAPQSGAGYFKVPKVIERYTNTRMDIPSLTIDRVRQALLSREFSAAELASRGAALRRGRKSQNQRLSAFLPGARPGRRAARGRTHRARRRPGPARPACPSPSRT